MPSKKIYQWQNSIEKCEWGFFFFFGFVLFCFLFFFFFFFFLCWTLCLHCVGSNSCEIGVQGRRPSVLPVLSVNNINEHAAIVRTLSTTFFAGLGKFDPTLLQRKLLSWCCCDKYSISEMEGNFVKFHSLSSATLLLSEVSLVLLSVLVLLLISYSLH